MELREKIARVLYDVEYSDGRPEPMVKPRWSVKSRDADAILAIPEIAEALATHAEVRKVRNIALNTLMHPDCPNA